MDIHVFRRSLKTVLLLAVPGLVFATVLTAIVAHSLFPWSWSWEAALMFGALISATDPVAVVALLKELGVSKRLATLIEGESLFNDGTAIVVFMVFYDALRAGGFSGSLFSVLAQFIWISAGGILLGIAVAMATIWWIRRVFNDALVEITVTIVAAYIAFLLAEQVLHVSGVLAVVTVGLALAGIGRTRISPEVAGFLHRFWEVAAYLANTLVFILVGVVIAVKSQFFGWRDAGFAIGLFVGITVIRAIVVTVLYPLMRRYGYGMSVQEATILTWGGLRGAVGLALALVVAQDSAVPAAVGLNTLNLAAAIVVLTLVLNGTTIRPLIGRLRMNAMSPARRQVLNDAEAAIHTETQKVVELLKTDRFLSGADWQLVRQSLPVLTMENEPCDADVDMAFEAGRRMLEAEKRSYWHQFHNGLLGPDAVRLLVEDADQALDRIAAGQSLNLESRCQWMMPHWIVRLQPLPLIGTVVRRAFFDRLTFDYDVARGFAVAQQEAMALLPQITSDNRIAVSLRREVTVALETVLDSIRTIHETFPEVIVAIETRTAARSVLNSQRNAVRKLTNDGLLDEVDAERWIDAVEYRMKTVADTPLTTPDKARLLREVPWLQGVDDSTFSFAMDSCKERVFGKGDRLVTAGDASDGLLIIARGRVDVRMSVSGEAHVIDQLGRGAVIGEIGALTGTNRTAAVDAETPVEAFWLSVENLRELIRMCPTLHDVLWHTAGRRLAENMLQGELPYSRYGILGLRRWLADGQIGKRGDAIAGQTAILMTGTADIGGISHAAPTVVVVGRDSLPAEATLFLCPPLSQGLF